jgi:hypothetical protein
MVFGMPFPDCTDKIIHEQYKHVLARSGNACSYSDLVLDDCMVCVNQSISNARLFCRTCVLMMLAGRGVERARVGVEAF